MNRALSVISRWSLIQDLESGTFDVLVIGGGITGAGIAWDAAKRGLKVALIEQGDFASGTSSRSTKLIHGGLRYLKKGEIRLVKEVGREREWLYGSAPHLVIPVPMLLPLYKGGTFGYWSASLGLAVYDRLAGVLKEERRVMLRAGAAAKQEPLLKGEGLKGGGLYYEYRSDDARLTVEVLKTAARHGALALNYMEASEFLYYKSKLCGVRAVDKLTNFDVEIRAKRVVNAAGPWVDLVRAKDHAIRGKNLLLTKGIHLVVSASKLPVKQAAYFDAPDGRMVFVIPRSGKTYIGTTDTVYSGDPGHIRVTESDRDYLLKAVEGIFPRVKLTAADVESMWAGLRPLIRQDGKKPSDISRKDEIWESPSGLITIAGGKLTGFRRMAEKVVDAITASIAAETRQTFAPCTTAREVLSGGESGRCETYDELREQLLVHGVKRGLARRAVSELLDRYGSNTSKIYMRLAELHDGFRTWKPEPPEPVRRPAAPDRGRAERPEGGWSGARAEGRGRLPADGAGGAKPEDGSRLPVAGETKPPEPLRAKPEESGGASLRGEAGAGTGTGTGAGAGAEQQASPGAPLSRKLATPESAKVNAEERAAWIREWNRREQQAAAASNPEERARWIREWNQRTGQAEAEALNDMAESASGVVRGDVQEEKAAGMGEDAGYDFADPGTSGYAGEDREAPAHPPQASSSSGTVVEEAWRQLEEMTERLRREESGKSWAASDRAASGGKQNPALALRPEEAWERRDGEPPEAGEEAADAWNGRNNNAEAGWGSREEGSDWTGSGDKRDWSSGEEEQDWAETATKAVEGDPGELSEWTGAGGGSGWNAAAEESGWSKAEQEPDWGNSEQEPDWSNSEQETGWSSSAEGSDPTGLEEEGGWGSQGAEAERKASGTPVESGAGEEGEGEGAETDAYFNSLEYKLLKAEVHYCVEEEMAVNASDFIIRRTGLLYFDRERAEQIAIDVIEIMAELLGWSEREVMKQKLQLAKEWELATTAFKWEQD